MAAYYSVTIRALPLLLLFFEEFINTFVSDIFQVLNHAHMVFGSVTHIKGFKPTAREGLAFMAETHKSLPDEVTMMFHKNTVLAAWPATGAVSALEPFLVQVNLHRDVTDTYSAVHPARSD
jgi:hypothetical protein